MNLHDLKITPPWEWPADAGNQLLATLLDGKAAEADRQVAAELAGELVVMNDELAAALINVLENDLQPEKIPARAAISLGPVLEQVDTDGFETPRTFRLPRPRFIGSRNPSGGSTWMPARRKTCVDELSGARCGGLRPGIATRLGLRLPATMTRGRSRPFSARFVKGFDDQTLEALHSTNPAIHYEAVVAAGNWAIEAAWTDIADLLASESTEKPLLLAAIEAVPTIRLDDAAEILGDLLDSDDEDIVDAVEEALALAKGQSGDAAWDDDGEEE